MPQRYTDTDRHGMEKTNILHVIKAALIFICRNSNQKLI